MENKILNKTLKYSLLIFGSVIIGMFAVIGGKAAIQSINGLAVAQTGTLWNNLKDGAFGDDATNGVAATSLYIFDGTNFDRVRGTGGSLNTTSVGTTTPADGFGNPTASLNSFALCGLFNGTTWDRCRGDITNGLDVDVTRTGQGTITPADAFTNPTDSIGVYNLNAEFNGTTWDRKRHSFSQSTTGVTTNAAGTTVTMTTSPKSKYSMVIDRTAGSTDVVEVDLQCSINNVAFSQIATITSLVGEPVITNISEVPCLYMRYNVVTIGVGNTLAIDIAAVN